MDKSKNVENKDKDPEKNEELKFEKLPTNHQKERKSVMIKPTKMNKMLQRFNTMVLNQENITAARRASFRINSKVSSTHVEDMHKKIKNIEKANIEKDRQIKEDIKQKKIVDKRRMSDRIDTMMKERNEKDLERVIHVKQNYEFSENTKQNYNKNTKLFQLNEKNINKIYGEKSKELSNEQKIHLLDRKINNCEIKEKINLNITMKNSNKEYQYETEIYDDEDKLISKTKQQGDKNEIILSDNSEINYNFTKSKSVKVVLVKFINNIEKMRTTMTIPLKKIFSKTNNEKYEEKIEKFTDNELINIDFDSPEEKKDDKLIELNFNTNQNKDNNSKISYSIQKNEKILFKSAVCNCSNIKKTDKIKINDLEPEFEISFYNEEYIEKKIKIKTEDLKNGVNENINFPNINNLKVTISSEEKESNKFIKLLKKGLNLNLSIAIDFTASNGYPECEDSLHKINDGFINNYEKAIRENSKIISIYNKEDKYDVYGFGADIDGEFKKIFNLNRSEDPNITGIENVISEYKKAVKNVEFSGGTYFAPIIKEVNRKLELNKNKKLNYNILLIISDGEIHDIEETIDSIIEASKYPFSIIIIGIGANVTYDMKSLNGENGKLISSKGEELNKDIVQYVHFNDFADDLIKLTEEVLKYIPAQISNYYKDE